MAAVQRHACSSGTVGMISRSACKKLPLAFCSLYRDHPLRGHAVFTEWPTMEISIAVRAPKNSLDPVLCLDNIGKNS